MASILPTPFFGVEGGVRDIPMGPEPAPSTPAGVEWECGSLDKDMPRYAPSEAIRLPPVARRYAIAEHHTGKKIKHKEHTPRS